jgi:hypothetical protein
MLAVDVRQYVNHIALLRKPWFQWLEHQLFRLRQILNACMHEVRLKEYYACLQTLHDAYILRFWLSNILTSSWGQLCCIITQLTLHACMHAVLVMNDRRYRTHTHTHTHTHAHKQLTDKYPKASALLSSLILVSVLCSLYIEQNILYITQSYIQLR